MNKLEKRVYDILKTRMSPENAYVHATTIPDDLRRVFENMTDEQLAAYMDKGVQKHFKDMLNKMPINKMSNISTRAYKEFVSDNSKMLKFLEKSMDDMGTHVLPLVLSGLLAALMELLAVSIDKDVRAYSNCLAIALILGDVDAELLVGVAQAIADMRAMESQSQPLH